MKVENDRRTRYHCVNLPKSETFACTKKDIREVFGVDTLDWVSLGGIRKKFEFDSRSRHRPNIGGSIIVSLTINRDNEANLSLYSIRKEHYPSVASNEFKSLILPSISIWLGRKFKRNETEILGHEQLLIEWDQQKYRKHELKFL